MTLPVDLTLGERSELRDEFAAKAMGGWLTTYPREVQACDLQPDLIAEFAYKMADAMMKARVA